MSSRGWNPKPTTRPGLPVELHTLDDKSFERLCSEIMEQEPNMDGCDVYGTKGQRQHGIDLIARETDSIHIQVGQCKCQRSFSLTDIRDASTEFLDHWDTLWSSRFVPRFVLCVACAVSATHKQDGM